MFNTSIPTSKSKSYNTTQPMKKCRKNYPIWKWITDTSLPSKVFLLPSPPMITSNSYSDTGWVFGWTNARQPIPVDKLQVNDNINSVHNKKIHKTTSYYPESLPYIVGKDTLQDSYIVDRAITDLHSHFAWIRGRDSSSKIPLTITFKVHYNLYSFSATQLIGCQKNK